ncbi:MAG: hypothetical protein ACI9GH_000115, partial [Candidatus Paceibacteria bacterium]
MEKHPLHIKTPELQKSEEVQKSVEKHERKEEEKVPNNPNERIDVHMDRLENIFLNEDESIRERNINILRPKIHDEYIIEREDVPESYFELQQQIARERGQEVEQIPQEVRGQMIDTIIEDQAHSLDRWIDYLTSSDATYPTWFKYFLFQNITKLSQFDKELGKFKKRTESTVAPFPDIYQEALAQVCDTYEAVEKDNTKLKDPEVQKDFSRSFPKVYAEKITEVLDSRIELGEETKGEWIKYDHNNKEHAQALYESLQGKGTGWCTAGKSTAETQIDSGDFYVYYTYDENDKPTQPRVAIRMDGDSKIGEVRGVHEHQEMEPQFGDVLDEKLQDFGDEKEKYTKKSEDMKRLTEIDKKLEKAQEQNKEIQLSKEDIRFLYEVDGKIEGFGYGKDPRIKKIQETRNVKEDLSQVFDCRPEQISLTKDEALSGDIVYHYGDLDLNSLTSAEGLELPQSIGGNLYLESLTSAEGLELPQSIGGYLYLESLTSAEGLKLPQSIGGDLYLNSLTSAEGLKLPQSIGGYLDLNSLTSAEDLKLPQSIGGYLYLSSLTSAEKAKLRERYPHLADN